MAAEDSIRKDGEHIRTVAGCMCSPTADPVTTQYFDALNDAFAGFADHNGMVRDYTDNYARKLAASRESMSAVEESNASAMMRPNQ